MQYRVVLFTSTNIPIISTLPLVTSSQFTLLYPKARSPNLITSIYSTPIMIWLLMIILPILWFLVTTAFISTLLYHAITDLLLNSTSFAFGQISLVVALFYLAFVALTVQDCFFPNRTPNLFKIHSAGPDQEQRGFGIDTQISRVRVEL